MPQPTPYDRLTNFQNDQALAPVDPYPAPKIDQEYNAIKITIDEILQNLALIQRDDGQLANDSVGWDQLKDEVLVGFGPPEPWETAHHYLVGNTVFEDDGFYLCIVEHTSGVFADDLAAGKWSLIVDFAAHTAAAEAAAAAAAESAADAAESAADATAAQGAFRWNFDSSTAMADPGVGDVRGNGTPASAITQIAISAQTADTGNPNILPWILTWDDSTNFVSRGTIYIRKVADPEIFVVFNLTGTVVNNGTWAHIGVTYVIHSGVLVNGEPVSVAFMRTGNQGATGTGGGDMLAAFNLSDVDNAAVSLANIGGVAKAGDTMTGDLKIEKDFPEIVLNSTTGSHATITLQDHGLKHWQFGEADLGNHLFLNRHNAAGVFVDMPLLIDWSSGVATFQSYLILGASSADGASLFFGPQSAGHRIFYAAAGNEFVTDGNFRSSGSVTAAGSVVADGGVVANGYSLYGTAFANGDSTFINIFGPPSLPPAGNIRLGGSSTPQNVYINDTHFFQDRASTVNYLTINDVGLSVRGNVDATGSMFCAGLNASAGVACAQIDCSGGLASVNSLFVNALSRSDRWQNDGVLWITTKGYQPGGGAWADTSDARIKTVNGPYLHGLAEIKQVNPVRYTFKGNDGLQLGADVLSSHSELGGQEFIGVIAQDIETVLPETVTKRNGVIDSLPVTDMRIYDSSALVYALVNACKELAARVEALEAAIAAPPP